MGPGHATIGAEAPWAGARAATRVCPYDRQLCSARQRASLPPIPRPGKTLEFSSTRNDTNGGRAFLPSFRGPARNLWIHRKPSLLRRDPGIGTPSPSPQPSPLKGEGVGTPLSRPAATRVCPYDGLCAVPADALHSPNPATRQNARFLEGLGMTRRGRAFLLSFRGPARNLRIQ